MPGGGGNNAPGIVFLFMSKHLVLVLPYATSFRSASTFSELFFVNVDMPFFILLLAFSRSALSSLLSRLLALLLWKIPLFDRK